MTSHALQGKSILVVGGSSGIGLATARAAVEAGAEVTIASRSSEKLTAAAKSIGVVRTLSFDVRDEVATAAALGHAGRFDHVAITSGSVAPTSVRDNSSEKARRGFESKFWGAWHVAAHADIAANGSLTLISGVFALRPQKGLVASSCVNAAIDALARALALDLAPIRVNAVSPGLIETPMWDGIDAARRAEFFAASTQNLPDKYLGQPEDIGALIIACMINPMLTGSILIADAGRVLV